MSSLTGLPTSELVVEAFVGSLSELFVGSLSELVEAFVGSLLPLTDDWIEAVDDDPFRLLLLSSFLLTFLLPSLVPVELVVLLPSLVPVELAVLLLLSLRSDFKNSFLFSRDLLGLVTRISREGVTMDLDPMDPLADEGTGTDGDGFIPRVWIPVTDGDGFIPRVWIPVTDGDGFIPRVWIPVTDGDGFIPRVWIPVEPFPVTEISFGSVKGPMTEEVEEAGRLGRFLVTSESPAVVLIASARTGAVAALTTVDSVTGFTCFVMMVSLDIPFPISRVLVGSQTELLTLDEDVDPLGTRDGKSWLNEATAESTECPFTNPAGILLPTLFTLTPTPPFDALPLELLRMRMLLEEELLLLLDPPKAPVSTMEEKSIKSPSDPTGCCLTNDG